MGYWDFSNIGYISRERDSENVEALLTCMGIDFNEQIGSEAGEINDMFYDATMGSDNSKLKPVEIYTIVNSIFGKTYILYEHEDGSSVNDYYSRYEEVYDPKTKKLYIGEKDYCYDGYTASGESAFLSLKDECEEAAKEKNVSIGWDQWGNPASDEFDEICRKVVENHGGLSGLGTKIRTENIPVVKVKKQVLKEIIDTAVKLGYDDLVPLIKQSFEKDGTRSKKKLSAAFIQKQLEEWGNDFDVRGTRYEGRNKRIENVNVGDHLMLMREPDNEYDRDAIDLRSPSGSIGHLPSELADVLSPAIDAGKITAVAEVISMELLTKAGKKLASPRVNVRIIVHDSDDPGAGQEEG